jgi:hypothetical protein
LCELMSNQWMFKYGKHKRNVFNKYKVKNINYYDF